MIKNSYLITGATGSFGNGLLKINQSNKSFKINNI